jgi:hypothetical protein
VDLTVKFEADGFSFPLNARALFFLALALSKCACRWTPDFPLQDVNFLKSSSRLLRGYLIVKALRIAGSP